MSVSQQGNAEDSASAVTAKTPEINEKVQLLLRAIDSEDGEGIANAFYSLLELRGLEDMAAALNAGDLTEKMLAILTKWAATMGTTAGWLQFAHVAFIMGHEAPVEEAAQKALQIDPATPAAALIVYSGANRRGEHDRALQVISDIVARVPAEKDNPLLILQTAVAEVNGSQPKAALATIDAGLPRLIAAGLESKAQALRAQALSAIPEQAADAVSAWKRAVEIGLEPAEIDRARDNLIAALGRVKRYDEALRQLDLAIAATTNEEYRSGWLQIRPDVLVKNGDIDGALAAVDNLLATTTIPEARIGYRLQQANIAAESARWKDAAAFFDQALTEVPADADDASQGRYAIRMQKVQTLAPHQIDIVLKDLDELDSNWTAPGWPTTIDVRIFGLTAAGRAAEALDWLEQRLARTPALADHPAAHQLRADIQAELGLIDDAMEECRRTVELAATAADPRALIAVQKCASSSQQWKPAIDAYVRLCKTYPASGSDPSLRVLAAFAFLRVGDPQTALNLTDDAEPPILNLMVMRGVCRGEAQVRLGRFDDALATTADTLERYQAVRKVAPSTKVSQEYMVLLHTLRAQSFNEKKEFEAGRRAATAAIEIPDEPGGLAGLKVFFRIAALMQRSLALYLLKKPAEAHQDIDQAINEFEPLRNTPIMKVIEQSPEFDRFEGALWYAKGSVLESEKCSEEALAAYTRSERLEKHGAAAAIARGYALSRTGAFHDALRAFDKALRRVASPKERAEAFAGKGRALVRLKKYEEAISALQSALDARLTERDDDPGVFEQLGIAYASLKRDGPAKRAFERAWELTPKNKRTYNLARGIVAAELNLQNPHAALDFLDGLSDEIAQERSLQFNRALALDATGQRRAAIRCLLAAKELGLGRAQAALDRLDAPAGLGRWTHYWFGAQTRWKRYAFGIVLVTIAGIGLAVAPLLQWWLKKELDWYLLLPSAVALLLLALPNIKSIGFEGAGLSFSAEPESATGRDAAAVGAPESFEVPTF